MKNPYDSNKVNDVIVDTIQDSIPYKEILDGSKVDNIMAYVRVNRKTWELYIEYVLLDSEDKTKPLTTIVIGKVHDPLLPFKLAGGYEIGELDTAKYLKELDKDLYLTQFPDFELPVLEFIRFPESLPRKMFRDNVTAYINYLVNDGKGHYLTDYWLLRWRNQMAKLRGHISIYNDILLTTGVVKRKGGMKKWRKKTTVCS